MSTNKMEIESTYITFDSPVVQNLALASERRQIVNFSTQTPLNQTETPIHSQMKQLNPNLTKSNIKSIRRQNIIEKDTEQKEEVFKIIRNSKKTI